MARTMPVNAGYSIINGSGTGTNGNRIHVWAEYAIGQADVANNRTWFSVYFYTALDPDYTASTQYHTGLNASCSLDGSPLYAVSDGAYDFTSADKVNYLGSFDGWVNHDADGKKTLTFAGSFTTLSTYISGGSVSGTVTLPDMIRAAEPAPEPVTLGSACRVCWTPALSRHSYRLTFRQGSWEHTTGLIAPGTTAAYTYTGLTLPMELAGQFTGATAEVTVALTTYDGDEILGTAEADFSVTVPENAQTRPAVTATLQPLCQAFPGLYVQKLGKVAATVTAEDPFGAPITGYTISAGGSPVSGTVSDYLERAGTVTVTVTAKNARGFTGTWQGEVSVIPYVPPRLYKAAAYRCLSDGTADPGGTFLRLEADWSHSPVEGENTCCLRWRYQSDGPWSAYQQIDAASAVDTGPIAGILLEKHLAYTVQLEVVDSAGGSAQTQFFIPVEQVYMHRTKNAMGLGGYAQAADTLDVHWDINARQGINGAYLRTVQLSAGRTIGIRTRFTTMSGSGEYYQSIFLFGSQNGSPVQGVVTVGDDAAVQWQGTEGVTVYANRTTGIVTVQLPRQASESFLLASPEPMELV